MTHNQSTYTQLFIKFISKVSVIISIHYCAFFYQNPYSWPHVSHLEGIKRVSGESCPVDINICLAETFPSTAWLKLPSILFKLAVGQAVLKGLLIGCKQGISWLCLNSVIVRNEVIWYGIFRVRHADRISILIKKVWLHTGKSSL